MKRIVYKLLIYINILLAITLLLSYVSVYVSPATLWIFAFLGLAYPYLLLINILFCLFWILFKKAEFMLSLIVILIGWKQLSNQVQLRVGKPPGYTEVVQASRQERMEQKQIKVLSFNIRAFNLYNWNKDQGDLNRIISFIREEDPDIICLQEFFAQQDGLVTIEDLYRRLEGTPFRHLHFTLGEGSNNMYGIATFSALPITGKGVIRFDNTLNASIFTDIKAGEDTIRIYNNHLQSIRFNKNNLMYLDSLSLRHNEKQIDELKEISFRLRDAFVKRARQAETIAGHIGKSPYQVLICGDFNDTPSSYTYHKLKNGFRDAFVEAGSGFGSTYAGRFRSFRIDYILHDSKIKALYFKREKIRLSDHYPIVSYLGLN